MKIKNTAVERLPWLQTIGLNRITFHTGKQGGGRSAEVEPLVTVFEKL